MNDTVSASLPQPSEIPFEFYSKPGNKTTKLADTAGNVAIDGSNRWYEFEFNEPVYLTEIRIESEGYDSWNNFEIEVLHTDRTRHVEKISVEHGVVLLSLGKLCQSFRFRPEKKWSSKVSIIKVVATGFSLKEFHEFEWEIRSIGEREAEVANREADLEAAKQEQATALKETKSLQSQIAKLDVQRTSLEERVQVLDEQSIANEAKKKDLQVEIESLQEERRGVRSEIAKDEARHSELTTKLRLFPSEIAGFVEQGNRNIRTYLLIGLPFTLILCTVLWSLFSSAIDLTQIWKLEDNVDVWTIFLTRIPFVIIAFALIEACGFIVGRLIFEIVKINRQRLDFAKLSIVAKDVTTASTVETAMSDEEKYQKETQLKMALLQEHMKSYTAEEFKYQGSTIGGAIIGLASKWLAPKAS